jgi:hypothetical protein
MRGTLRKWFCFHCHAEAEPYAQDCQALKWVVKNEDEVAYCHLGKHNHDLEMLESKTNVDEQQLQVMSMVRADRSMTPSRVKTAAAMTSILEEMEQHPGEDCVDR